MHETPPQPTEATSPAAVAAEPTTPGGASCSDGPSKGRSIALAPAPGVAEEQAQRQGAPNQQPVAEGGHEKKPKPKQGRRRARQDKQRGKRQTFRASEAEDAEIQAAADAKGVSKARFMAQAVLAEVHDRTGLDQDEALDRLDAARVQLARVGNNLNQIARILNSGADVIHIDRAAGEVREAAAAVKAAAQRVVG